MYRNDSVPFKEVVRGGSVFFAGTIIATFLQFLFGIFVIRFLSPANFGIFSVANIIVNILVTFAVFGFDNGVPRFLGKYRNQERRDHVNNIVITALVATLIFSIILSFLLLSAAGPLAKIIDKPSCAPVLRLFALMITPLSLLTILTAIFRGFGNSKAKVWFQDLALKASRMALLVIVIYFGLGFKGVQGAYVASGWIAFVMYIIYFIRCMPEVCSHKPRPILSTGKDLIFFSAPLLGSAIVINAANWTATGLLVYLKSSEAVAFYNAPLRIAAMIAIPLDAMVFMYLPVATSLIERSAPKEELRHLYISVTKWVFLCTLPVAVYLLLDAKFFVEYLFGANYVSSVSILRILVIGFLIHSFLGPNGMTLIAHGDPKTVLIGAVLTSVSSIIFCLCLIPSFGAIGAAVGVSCAKIISNTFISSILYIRHRVHPFTGVYIKPAIFTIGTIFIIWILTTKILPVSIILHLSMPFVFVLLGLLSPIPTRTLTAVDFQVISALEMKFWGKARLLKFLRLD